MKQLFALMILAIASPAFADVAPSTNSLDFGIVAGALASKTVKLKAGKTTYHVIATDLVEPACNSVQAVIWVDDENVEGDAGGVAYNLGLQFSSLVNAKAKGEKVVVTVRRNDPSDCTQGIVEAYEIQYAGNAGNLAVKKIK